MYFSVFTDNCCNIFNAKPTVDREHIKCSSGINFRTFMVVLLSLVNDHNVYIGFNLE